MGVESGYIAAFWFIVVAALTVPLMLGIGALLRPKRFLSRLKATPYECGEKPVGEAWVRFNIRFYMIAIVFIIFDVEVVTVFPTATLYREAVQSGEALLAFIKIFLFIALLLVGLVYSWARGDLDWVRSLQQPDKASNKAFPWGGGRALERVGLK